MCWIAWVITHQQWTVTIDLLDQANKKMSHRWPDAQRIWVSENKRAWFSHVRLSIVDLDTRSDQPFCIDNGDFVIVFNGEIYNYLILKELLIREHNVQFTTTSDTEVLIYMYKHYGAECLQYLEWMFAFSIYDKKQESFFVARDFVGQKPLVYAIVDDNFYFASEIPALFALCPSLSKEINISVMQLYCIDNLFHIPGKYSIFSHIHKLEPASYLIIKNWQIVESHRYAVLDKNGPKHTTWEVPFLYDKLQSMKPKDIDYASFLSWGVDSSFVCSGLKKNSEKATDAYTLKIWPVDEDFERSQYVAEKLDLNQHVINIDTFDMLASVKESIHILWEPYFHITSVFADHLLQHANQKHKVVFTGAWGDECYYGYNNLRFIFMDVFFACKKLLLPARLGNAINYVTKDAYKLFISSTVHTFKQNYFIHNLQKTATLFLDKSQIAATEKLILSLVDDFKKAVTYSSYIDFSYMFGLFIENMHSLVIQWDLVGMKNSIEMRSLFLEQKVIERAYTIPLYKKVSLWRPREGKEILRRQLVKLFWRKFLYAKKIWFGVEYDFKNQFSVKYQSLIYEKITALLQRKIFDPMIVEELMKDFSKNFWILMKFYSLEIWFEKFID